MRPYLEKTHHIHAHTKRTGKVAQGLGPEFKTPVTTTMKKEYTDEQRVGM
jgi:hypothetical protein